MLSLARSMPTVPRTWRSAGLLLAVLLTLFFFAYRESFATLLGLWLGSENYSHAVVVPPIALWLAWRKRDQLLALTPKPSVLLMPLLALLTMVWLVGDLSATNALEHFSLIATVVVLVIATLGFEVARVLRFPLLFLFFGVPFGEFLFPTMMTATADFTVAALRLSGVPVYREGLQFVIPTGHWSVIEACSGLRYLIASIMVGTLFAYLNFQSLRRRLAFIAVAIAVPILANWVRAYMIVMIGHLSGNKLAVGVDHLIYGWAFFGFVMVLIFMIGARFSEPAPEAAPLPVSSARTSDAEMAALWQRMALVGLASVAVLAAPLLAIKLLDGSVNANQPGLAAISAKAGWQSAEAMPGQELAPHYQPPSAVLRQAFRNSHGATVGLYIAYYRHQEANRKLVSSENRLTVARSEEWAQMRTGETVAEGEGESYRLDETELRAIQGTGTSQEQRLIVWQLNWVNGQWVHGEAQAKFQGAIQRLLGHGDDGASVLFYVDKAAPGGPAAALSSFVHDNLPLIEARLRQAQSDLPATH